MRHYGDITKLSGYQLPIVDCIIGGSPCQDLSVAGKRQGLDGARSGLFFEQIRIVKEMRESDRANGRTGQPVRPRYMVWENVPGAFSSNGGRDFQIVLSEIVKIAEPNAPDVPMPDKGKWPKAGCLYDEMGGWSVAYRLHDAQFWGVPQRRKRISLVADFGGLSAPEILFERKSVSGHFEPGEAQGQAAPAGAGSGADAAISFLERGGISGGGKGILIQKDRSGALASCAQYTVQAIPIHDKATRVCYPDKARALTARMDGSPCLDRVPDIVCTYDARGCGDGKTVATITDDHESRVTDYTALCVGNGQLNQISMSETANTLDTMHDQQAILYAAADCRNGTESGEISGTLQAVVRRLTPMETERLQGFPDNWSKYGMFEDGTVKELSNSARYRLQGNSIALPFWRWIIKQISAQYERTPTMGSLFDGQGGFPLLWEGVNGKGTAVWASEIEKNAVAVTKYHFSEDVQT